jgi:hypothetical protein
MIELKVHPAADWLPELSLEEFRELVDDIKTRGQREPILVRSGHIIDGRHRYQACRELGIEPRIEEYEGADCLAEIFSRNLLPRHLTTEQRAKIAAKLIPQIKNGEILSGPNEPESKRPAHRPNTGGRTVEKAANIMRVSASSVKRAQQRLKQSLKEKRKPKPQIDKTDPKFVIKRLQKFFDFWPVTKHRVVRKICREFLNG